MIKFSFLETDRASAWRMDIGGTKLNYLGEGKGWWCGKKQKEKRLVVNILILKYLRHSKRAAQEVVDYTASEFKREVQKYR